MLISSLPFTAFWVQKMFVATVAIGNPERDVRKASHYGSKQQ